MDIGPIFSEVGWRSRIPPWGEKIGCKTCKFSVRFPRKTFFAPPPLWCCKDAKVQGHTTTAMHDMSTPPPVTEGGLLVGHRAYVRGNMRPRIRFAICTPATFVHRNLFYLADENLLRSVVVRLL